MTKRQQQTFAAALVVLGVLMGLTGMWWWALFGMHSEVGGAVAATAATAVAFGCAVVAVSLGP